MTSSPETFDDLRALLTRLPGPDEAARAAAEAREPRLTKPPGALGRLENIAHWLAAWQGRHPPAVKAPRVLVFAGNHGVAAEGVSAFPPEVTAQMVGNFQAGGAAVNQIARAAGAEFSVVALELDRPTQSFTKGPAMSETETMAAFAAGWRAAGEAECDLLAVGEMGIANTASAAAIACALFGGDAADWTGPGTGVAGAALARKTDVVARAVQLHGADIKDGLDALARLGGRETAAMAGAVTCARMNRTPVVLDGYVAGAAAAALEKTAPGAGAGGGRGRGRFGALHRRAPFRRTGACADAGGVEDGAFAGFEHAFG
ncbi:MAG: nicotinate-nucleotide--dimethylbenzimidazole phosphoribosyltransferase [Rhodospirillales bacterium]